MIGRLKGELVEKQPPHLLVDVSGVGYELEASLNTVFKLPDVGKPVTLYTHFVVREDAQLLYGFADREERLLFRTLIKANGVGPKLALAILSGMTPQEFIRSVNDQDTAALVRLPGVGKKTAERLIVEIKDKLNQLSLAETGEFSLSHAPTDENVTSAPVVNARAEAESALVALGYKPVQATKAVASAEDQLGASATSEALIRQALRSMV